MLNLSRRGLFGSAAFLTLSPSLTFAQSSPTPAPAPAPTGPKLLDYPGKDKLVLLGDKPLVAETPEAMLNDDTTPIAKFFIRNNGVIPDDKKLGDAWKIIIEGEVNTRLELSLADLKKNFKAYTFRMVLECGGNGRSQYQPIARGNPWTNGGVSCAEWTGVRLADVLKKAGLKSTAKYTGHFSADIHLSGDATKTAISRGMPIEKALEPHTMIVWAMNGEPLPHIHGGPVRLVVPGWPASLSNKWLTKILVRSTPHDGAGMGGTSYRIPTSPIIPGANVDGKTGFTDMTSMPLRSIITSPANGTKLAAGTKEINLRGAAWAGDFNVRAVDVSIDGGQNWKRMKMAKPKNRYDWVRWSGKINLASNGYYDLLVRAFNDRGIGQPVFATNWNPQGYGANAHHRIAVLVG